MAFSRWVKPWFKPAVQTIWFKQNSPGYNVKKILYSKTLPTALFQTIRVTKKMYVIEFWAGNLIQASKGYMQMKVNKKL